MTSKDGSNGLKNGSWIPFHGSLAKYLQLLWWYLFVDRSCLKNFEIQKVHFQLSCLWTNFNFAFFIPLNNRKPIFWIWSWKLWMRLMVIYKWINGCTWWKIKRFVNKFESPQRPNFWTLCFSIVSWLCLSRQYFLALETCLFHEYFLVLKTCPFLFQRWVVAPLQKTQANSKQNNKWCCCAPDLTNMMDWSLCVTSCKRWILRSIFFVWQGCSLKEESVQILFPCENLTRSCIAFFQLRTDSWSFSNTGDLCSPHISKDLVHRHTPIFLMVA